MTKLWWISCNKFTVGVECENDIITNSAPHVKMFRGQNIQNLFKWVNKNFKDIQICKLK